MVTVTGKLGGHDVCAEVHGPHDVRGDSALLGVAVLLINGRHRVYGTILTGGGTASFEHERIAVATLAEICDEGTVTIDGLDPSVPAGAVA
jgi:hypothetical protein